MKWSHQQISFSMSLRIQISVHQFLSFVYLLPICAFLTCISLTLIKDHRAATHTHCNVTNILPSISAVIAAFEPQRFIWRFAFALDSLPRYLIAYLQFRRAFHRYHVASLRCYQCLQILNSCVHCLELTFLLLLTYVSSNEKKSIHIAGFVGFVFCSVIHMFLTVMIDYQWKRTKEYCWSEKEKSCRVKRLKCFLVHLLSLLIAMYFYVRHNRFCEPYIYSMFCLFEYCVILTNMTFHSIIREEWDEQEGQIQIFY